MKTAYKNMFVRLSLFALLVFIVYMLISLRLQNNALDARAEELRARMDDVDTYISELEADLAAPFDDEYVEKVAEEKLGMCYPQEIIYYTEESEE